MLADVLDGTLSAEQQAVFDLHVAGCPECSTMLAEARRGAAWLEMLSASRPQPSPDLLNRIFSQTTGLEASARPALTGASQTATINIAEIPSNTLLGVPSGVPFRPAATGKVLPFRQRVVNAFRLESLRHTLMQPRLAMTAAMAFFSITLTLNLTGVRLSQLRASDFTPSSIKRSFWNANAHFARTVDNMRVVYELESRVRDLQRANDNDAPIQNTPAPAIQQNQPDSGKPDDTKPEPKHNNPHSKSGTSRRESPDNNLLLVGHRLNAQKHQGPVLLQIESGPTPAALEAFDLFVPSIYSKNQEGGLV